MILFVFEGAEREPRILKTLARLFFGEEERLVCSFGNNIFELYRQLEEYDGDGDLVSILRENKADLPPGVKSSDFSEIYLFFDYDFQNENLALKEMNRRLREMLELFDDETDNGKLYVSYPMVESLYYTKELPDELSAQGRTAFRQTRKMSLSSGSLRTRRRSICVRGTQSPY